MPQEDRTVRLVLELHVKAISAEDASQLTEELVQVMGHAVTAHLDVRNQAAIETIIEDIHINHEAYLAWRDAEGK